MVILVVRCQKSLRGFCKWRFQHWSDGAWGQTYISLPFLKDSNDRQYWRFGWQNGSHLSKRWADTILSDDFTMQTDKHKEYTQHLTHLITLRCYAMGAKRVVSRMQWRFSNEGSAGKMCSCQAVAHFVRDSKGQLGSLQVARSPLMPTKQTLAGATILWPSPVGCRTNSGPSSWCDILETRLRKKWLSLALIIPSCSLRVEAKPNLAGPHESFHERSPWSRAKFD